MLFQSWAPLLSCRSCWVPRCSPCWHAWSWGFLERSWADERHEGDLKLFKINSFIQIKHYYIWWVVRMSLFEISEQGMQNHHPHLHRRRRMIMMMRGGTCSNSTHQKVYLNFCQCNIEMGLDALCCCSPKEIKKVEGEDYVYTCTRTARLNVRILFLFYFYMLCNFAFSFSLLL